MYILRTGKDEDIDMKIFLMNALKFDERNMKYEVIVNKLLTRLYVVRCTVGVGRLTS